MPCRFFQPIDACWSVGQRLGHQDVVPHRDDVGPYALHQRGEHVGGQGHPARAHRAVRGGQVDARRVRGDPGDLGVLVEAHPELLAGRLQPPGQLGRVDEGAPVTVEQPGLEDRRVHLGLDRVLVEELDGAAVAGLELRGRAEVVDLPGSRRDRQLAGPLELGVDPVARERRLDRVEVVPPELHQLGELGLEARVTVAEAVGERGLAEAAVATGGGPADLVALEEHDVEVGVGLLGLQRGPQPGVAATDHGEVRGGRADEGRCGVGPAGGGRPERHRLGVGQDASTLAEGAGRAGLTVRGGCGRPDRRPRAAGR